MNPILHNAIDIFCIKFSKKNINIIINLTTLLIFNENLTPAQWAHACGTMDIIIQNISTTIEHTCIVPTTLLPMKQTSKQGRIYLINYKNNRKNNYSLIMLLEKQYILPHIMIIGKLIHT